MSPPNGMGDDPAALERAAAELREIAAEARRQAAVIGGCEGRVKPVATGVASVISGTASNTDKKMIGMLERVLRELKGTSHQLQEAARTADRLAYEATVRALQARERAAQPPRRR